MCEGASQRANKFSESVGPAGLAERAERVSRRSCGVGSNTVCWFGSDTRNSPRHGGKRKRPSASPNRYVCRLPESADNSALFPVHEFPTKAPQTSSHCE